MENDSLYRHIGGFAMKKPWIGKTLMVVLAVVFIAAFYILQTMVENIKNTYYDATLLIIWNLLWPLLLSALLQYEHLKRLLSRGKASIRIDMLILSLILLSILVLGFYPFHYIGRTDMAQVVLILFWSSALQVVQKDAS